MRSGSWRSLVLCLVTVAVCCPCGAAFASDDSATLVIYRPKKFTSGAVGSSFRVNGERLGGFKSGIFEIRVDPGLHEVRNFFPAKKEEKFDAEGEVKWGTYVHEVDAAPGETVYLLQTTKGPLMEVARAELGDEFGKTPRREPLVASVSGTFVTPGEASVWERCSAGEARDCSDYLERYPYGAYVAEAKAAVAAAEPAPAPAASIPARTRTLPVAIQRDKYMLALTSALKEERWADALVYFGELERLEVELSPSFWFYYGEALYHTGDYDAAIDKLYAYIARAGSDGEHYHRALELSTEAEER